MTSKSARLMGPALIFSPFGFVVGGPVGAIVGLIGGFVVGELYHRLAVLEQKVEALESQE
ncbi:hypothetical protein [Halapricum hydrolyticum]|uniref:Uncharacterized protein n=1 Tax=Halapricum hydrolyticum TaxID=2979991 RepID=A0AAE3ID19_9EURY|nr:hypothetical protein [Halapricum hydrolyticum]MCU4719367.1 hypothetical protein [Halapricum hydrolyticum]MCU4728368.1 hypothetical protein [Halapricum hydrolyticum]